MTKKATLLWIDLEMTGLEPTRDRILEVGVIATDWRMNEIARYEAVVKVSPRLMRKRMKGDFWDKNVAARDALIAQNSAGRSARTIENELLDFIEDNFNAKKPIYLAGNSIHQDRKFIEREWPELDKKLHYRMLDVSAWKIVFENIGHKKITKPEAHRAMDDITGSIEELRYYLRHCRMDSPIESANDKNKLGPPIGPAPDCDLGSANDEARYWANDRQRQ